MTTIVTRAGKGSPLTNNEVDTNFTNLNDAKIETLTSNNGSIVITGTGSTRNLSITGSTAGGGGASVLYYLNGSVNQGTLGGNTYYEMSRDPIFGAGTDFTIAADGYIAQFITDAADPSLLNIPAGNWTMEMYFSASAAGGTPAFYLELYKYNGTTFTLIASGSTNPEGITGGTSTDLYITSLGVPQTTLAVTDRLAIRVYVIHSGRTITLHTENSNLCQIITTFSTGLNALNGLTAQVQGFAVGTAGTDFNISSVTDVHTFNLPSASSSVRGALTSADWTTFNGKVTSVSGTSPVASSGGTTPAISLASGYGDTQNPYASKTANNFLAAPNGSAGVPTFRAIVAADIPTLNQNTTGTASNVTGVVAVANGGTGLSSTPTNGQLNIGNGTGFTRAALTAGSGISVTNGAGSISIANTGVTSLTAGTGISVSAGTGGVTISNTSTGATITDDTTTNATRYVLFDDVTSGTLTAVNTSSSKLFFNPSTGTLTSTVHTTNSDERLKENWTELPSDFLINLAQVKHGVFSRIDSGNREPGVTAQSLLSTLPEAVVEGADGYLSVNYGAAALVSAIELAKVVEELRAEVALLKAKLGE